MYTCLSPPNAVLTCSTRSLLLHFTQWHPIPKRYAPIKYTCSETCTSHEQ